MELPVIDLAHGPVRHPHCCLSLSSTLLTSLTNIALEGNTGASETRVVLSIGSGTGLLEAFLAEHARQQLHDSNQTTTLVVEGVEVTQPGTDNVTPNIYLPEQHSSTVRWSWEVSSRLRDPDVSAVMFVYPRQPALVTQYVKAASELPGARAIVWLGPVADLTDFESCFTGYGRFELRQGLDEETGLEANEMMAVWRR